MISFKQMRYNNRNTNTAQKVLDFIYNYLIDMLLNKYYTHERGIGCKNNEKVSKHNLRGSKAKGETYNSFLFRIYMTHPK